MSEVTFEIISEIKDIPNAKNLEIACVSGFECVVPIGAYKAGHGVIYIPEASIVPDDLLEQLGLTGCLAGSKRNRVKAKKIRGVLSQGILAPSRTSDIHPLQRVISEAQLSCVEDLAAVLGITKYEPPVPAKLAGNMLANPNPERRRCLNYNIDNIKKNKNVFTHSCVPEGEQVVITEKIHGTFFGVGILPTEEGREYIVFSKGLGGRDISLKLDDPANKNNLYVRVFNKYKENFDKGSLVDGPIYILGEIFGRGVQDLTYGYDVGDSATVGFRIFDIFHGYPDVGNYLDEANFASMVELLGVPRTPVLYTGPFSYEKLHELTDGKETISGEETHMREGVDVKPTIERGDRYGRVIYKSISADYLLRKKGTEYT